MPLCVDPKQTFDIVLAGDADAPETGRTRFRFRYLSAREFLATCELADTPHEKLTELYSAAEIVGKLLDTLRINLVDILHRPERSSKLEDIITVSEAWELFYQARRQSRLEVAEKNASASPSDLPGDASAQDADPESPAATP